MKLQVQILVILNESHINYHRGERPTVFCLLLLNHLRIPDSLNGDNCRIFFIAGWNNATRQYY